jgi:anti-sigma-K factor RskA
VNCAEVDELSGAYALRALPAGEMQAVGDHLAGCSRHPEIAEFQEAILDLAHAAPDAEPSPGLRSRISEAVRAEPRRTPPAAEPTKPVRRGFFSGWSLPRLAPYGLAAAFVLLVIGVTAGVLTTGGDSDTSAAVIQLSGPSGASGSITLEDDGTAVLAAEGLEPLPDDQTYQMWTIQDGAPTSIGIFDAEPDGTASSVIEPDLAGVESIAVTVEPAGGSALPTTDPVLTAEIS